MVNKNKCYDMFQYTKVDGMAMYEEQTLKQTLDYKYARNSRQKEYFKIKSIISLHLI